jgi:hypothetical protein
MIALAASPNDETRKTLSDLIVNIRLKNATE